MELRFFGAAGEVTGSCHVLTVRDRRILLDCGMIQGSRRQEERNRDPWPFEPADVDAVILSHAHIDHSGRLPLLVKDGYRGPVYAQRATRDLCRIMLRDSGFIAEKEAESENRKRLRKGLALVTPLFTIADASRAMRRFRGLPYGERIEVLPGVELRFRDAGHILGSCIVELFLSEGGVERKLVFSGDLGQTEAPILRDPEVIDEADVVLMESTYGDRNHRSRADTVVELGEIFRHARKGGGNIMIPAFAVGRSQELIYHMSLNQDAWGLEHWHVFLDSPMAIEASEVYARYAHLYDDDASELWSRRGGGPGILPHFTLSRTANQSRAINRIRDGAVIIAGSGMCEGGRIKHHLKNNVWRDECHVVIVGYQAHGTLGRRLVDGARNIRLWGETIRVGAAIHTVGGLSAHADQAGLFEWYAGFRDRPPVFLVHGETAAQEALRDRLNGELGAQVRIARCGERYDLIKSRLSPAAGRAA
jgi:metallo-beta-lactamase family protein